MNIYLLHSVYTIRIPMYIADRMTDFEFQLKVFLLALNFIVKQEDGTVT